MKKKILLALLISSCAHIMFAQNLPSYFKQGNEQFDLKNYYEAAQFYEQFLKTEKMRNPRMAFYSFQKNNKGYRGSRHSKGEAMFRLAESYRQIHDYKNAEKWYEEAAKHLKDSSACIRYLQAVCMRANEKYEQATDLLAKLVADRKISNKVKADAYSEIQNLEFINAETNKQRDDFSIEALQDSMYTSAYALAQNINGEKAFTAIARQGIETNKNPSKNAFTNALYTSQNGPGFIIQQAPFEKGATNMQTGMASFSADGRRMYFTRWYKKDGRTYSAIYLSLKQYDGRWGASQILDEKINLVNYNASQPFITDDGKYLLYASDRPGGYGKNDLWCASLDAAGNVFSTENLGETINTAQDEYSPYFHLKSKTLVFSSNGRIGMGGFDIYSAQGSLANEKWTEPINAGLPINSSKDDMFFISTDKTSCWNTGYISSDRHTNCCMAIYTLKLNTSLKVKGKIESDDGKALAGVTVKAIDIQNRTNKLQSATTDENGNYSFDLKNVSDFDLVIEKDNFKKDTTHISHQLKAGEDRLENQTVLLESVVKPKNSYAEELNRLTSNSNYLAGFDFAKSNLDLTASANLDTLVSLMNRFPNAKVQLGGYTDKFGSSEYNLKLAQKRADACIKHLVNKGIDKERLISKAFGECCALQTEIKANGKDDPAARKHNRRVEYIFLQ